MPKIPVETWLIGIVTVAIIGKILAPQLKGYFGEMVIRAMLGTLDRKKYIVINDLMLKTGGMTSQIDHVVVSDYGIFVIETKNYSGWIYGDEDSPKWTQTLPKNKFQFMNPILQNQGHIKAIQRHLSGFSEIKYIPIIVFMHRAVLKVKTQTPVMHATWLLWNMRRHKEIQLTYEDKTEIARRLVAANVADPELRRQHVKYVKRNTSGNRKTYQAPQQAGGMICPRCFSLLVPRLGWGSSFFGCSRYPRCRYTRKS